VLARKEFENEFARISRRRRGRPALGLELPALVQLRATYGKLRQLIKDLRHQKRSATEQHPLLLAELRAAVGAHVELPIPVFEQARKGAPHKDAPSAAIALRLLAHAIGCSPNVLKNSMLRASVTQEHVPPKVSDL
jgi:hypothetical protein